MQNICPTQSGDELAIVSISIGSSHCVESGTTLVVALHPAEHLADDGNRLAEIVILGVTDTGELVRKLEVDLEVIDRAEQRGELARRTAEQAPPQLGRQIERAFFKTPPDGGSVLLWKMRGTFEDAFGQMIGLAIDWRQLHALYTFLDCARFYAKGSSRLGHILPRDRRWPC